MNLSDHAATYAELLAPGEDCFPFNPAYARAQLVNGSWKIVVGSIWLEDFGTSQSEAERSLAIIKHYSLDEQCSVARPGASFRYYLQPDSSRVEASAGRTAYPSIPMLSA